MSLSKKNGTTLVSGGAGFLGSHLCETLLAKGEKVLCVDNFVTGSDRNLAAIHDHPQFRLEARDICEPFDPGIQIGRIYNLGCVASPPHYQADPVQTMRSCVVGTINLLELAERHGARFLQASTSEVYGDPEVHPQNEAYNGNVNCTGPRACYDEGKRAAEAMCFDFKRAGRVDVRVARIFNTYGPRMQPNDGRVVSNMIVQALRGQALTVYGDGSQTRSFCYVGELVDGLYRLMEAEPTPQAQVNLGNPDEFTILELAELIRLQIGAPAGIRFEPLPNDDPQRRRPDIACAIKLLNWRPKTTLQEGLAITVDYFREVVKPGAVPAGVDLRSLDRV
jgi:UDP-glucuronate decarboxylase